MFSVVTESKVNIQKFSAFSHTSKKLLEPKSNTTIFSITKIKYWGINIRKYIQNL